MAGAEATKLELTAAERQELTRLVAARSTGQQVALRARIVLVAAGGLTNAAVGRVGRLPRGGAFVAGRWAACRRPPERTARWRTVWRMRPDREHPPASVPSRSARSSPWPAKHPSSPAARSASGPAARSPTRSPGAASWRPSRTACRSPRKKGDLQPHLIRYWLTSAQEADFDAKVADSVPSIRSARAGRAGRTGAEHRRVDWRAGPRTGPSRLAHGAGQGRTARVRVYPARHHLLPDHPRCGQRADRGPLLWPDPHRRRLSCPSAAALATDPLATRWHMAADNLNIHPSTPLVRVTRPARDSPRTSGSRASGHPAHPSHPRRVPGRPPPLYRPPLHPQTCLLDEPNRDLAEYFDPQSAPARQFHLA